MISVCLAQVKIDSLDNNFKKILEILEKFDSNIYVFPEMFLTGYDIFNLPDKNEIIEKIGRVQNSLKDEQIVVFGSAYYEEQDIYNVAVVVSKRNIEIYYKNTLTEYDKRVFKTKNNTLIIEFNGLKIGFIICRDQSNIELLQRYKDKIDLLIQLSAHYYEYDEAIKKLDRNIAYPIIRAVDIKAMVCKVNCVGSLNNWVSLGCSMVVGSNGTLLKIASKFEEEVIQIKLRRENGHWVYDGSI